MAEPPFRRVVLGAPPGTIQATDLKSWKFNNTANADTSVLTVDANLPYVVVYNADTVAHTVTGQLRSGPGIALTTIPFSVPAGGYLPLPTSVFGSILDGTPNGNLYAFYSDVSPGPSSGGGALATTVNNNFQELITPNANTTIQMGGLGSVLAIKPLKTGTVRVRGQVTLQAGVVGDFVASAWAYGTGAPPAIHAAATGTLIEGGPASGGGCILHLTVATDEVGFTVEAVVTGLTLGTTYWFDLQSYVTTAASDAITIGGATVSELPA